MKTAFSILTLALVASCGPLNEGRNSPKFLQQLQSSLSSKPDAPAAPAIPPEIANAGPGEVLLVTLLARNAVAPMLRTGTIGSRVTWKSPGGISMTFEDSILISTRGVGDDLMGADVTGIGAAVRAGQGTVTRRNSYLNSLDQTVTYEMTCEISTVGTEETALLTGPTELVKVKESCNGARLMYENSYWLRGGKIIKSQQVISPSQGYISAEQL